MRAYERLIKYAMVPTASNENSAAVPTTECQFNLAHILVHELQEMGVKNARVDDKCYVYASIPATPGCEEQQSPGLYFPYGYRVRFCGSIWCSRSSMQNYDGKDLPLGESRTYA